MGGTSQQDWGRSISYTQAELYGWINGDKCRGPILEVVQSETMQGLSLSRFDRCDVDDGMCHSKTG